MKKHVFDVEVAKMVGVNAAILLENIAHWCEHNKANEENYHDGHYWTFNSMKAFEELFPYIKARGIRTALDKLKEEGLIIVGNYNKSAYDRTQWYTLTEKSEALFGIDTSICQKRQMEMSEVTNQSVTNDAPIPDINTCVTSGVNTSVKKEERKRHSFDAIIDAYTSNATTKELLGEWLQNRKAKRSAMTDNAIKRNIDKLDAYATQSNMSVDDYLAEVIRRGWQAFYPIKSYQGQGYKQQAQAVTLPAERRETQAEQDRVIALMSQFRV